MSREVVEFGSFAGSAAPDRRRILLALVTVLGCSREGPTRRELPGSHIPQRPAVVAPAAALPSARGDAVRFPDSEWVALGTTTATSLDSPIGAPRRRTHGQFVTLNYRVINRGAAEARVGFRPVLVDAMSRNFEPLDDERSYVPPTQSVLDLDPLQPGVEQTFQSVFELPMDAAQLRVRFHPLSVTGEAHDAWL